MDVRLRLSDLSRFRLSRFSWEWTVSKDRVDLGALNLDVSGPGSKGSNTIEPVGDGST